MLLQHSFFINKKQLALFSSASQRRSLISICLLKAIKSSIYSFFAGVLSVMLMLVCEIGWGQTQTFTSSGTFTVPAGVTSITISAWGSGAGGDHTATEHRGGGGGAYAGGTYTVTSGIQYTVTVGQGAAPGSGGNGQNSSFQSLVVAAGANGRFGGMVNNSTGQTIMAGGNGGTSNNQAGAGGGGSAGAGGAGGAGTNATGKNPGAGGAAGIGTPSGAAGGNGGSDGESGENGGFPGGGGGERGNGNYGIQSGGGGDGQVIVSWTCPTYSIDVTSASSPVTLGNASTITLSSSSLPSGTYTVSYSLSSPNAYSGTATMTFTAGSPGTGTFTTGNLSSTGVTTVTILNLASGGGTGTGTTNCSNGISSNNSASINVIPVRRYSVASGNWNSTSTWATTSGGASGASVPANGVEVYIEGGYTVTLNANTNALSLLNIASGSKLTTTGANRLNSATATIYGTYTNGSTGTVNVTNLSFNNGSTYNHAQNGGTIPTATWDANSTCLVTGVTSTFPTNMGQTLGNVTWNCPGQTVWGSNFVQTNMQILGNLTMQSTNNVDLGFCNGDGTTSTLSIGGDLIITGGVYRISYQNNVTHNIVGNINISGGTLLMNSTERGGQSGTGTINVDGNVSITSGTLNFSQSGRCDADDNGIINVKGNFTHSGGTIIEEGNATGDAINFTGSSGQSFSSIGTSGTINYGINNYSGVALNSDLTVTGTLSFTNGIFTTNSNTLIINNTSSAAISGAQAGRYVNGNLRWAFPTGAQSRTFAIGDAASYSPVTVNLTGITSGGTLTGRTDGGDLSSIAASNIDEYQSVNRNWTFSNSGISPANYSITLNYNASESDFGTTPSSYILGKLDGSMWTYPTISGTPTTTSLSATGLTGFSSFQIGQGNTAPNCTVNPSNQTTCEGSSISFTGAANSKNEPSVSWEINNGSGWSTLTIASPYSVSNVWNGGANTSTSTLTVTPTTTSLTGYQYRVKFTNTKGSCTAASATLTVNSIPSSPSTTDGLICVGSTATLSASGAASGDVYSWYLTQTGGTPLQANTDNTYTTTPALTATTNYWVSIRSAAGCESSRTQVTATFPDASPDNQNTAGLNSWIGHTYDGEFGSYYGTITESEEFDEGFGGQYSCFTLNSSLGTRFMYSEYFAVRYRMTSDKKGLYVVNLGSDDRSRLSVDGTTVFDNWIDQSFSDRLNVLLNLSGSSSLVYDFYEAGVDNRVVFQNLTLVLSNTLTTNTNQSVCLGSSSAEISGDVFGTIPTGISLSGTGYQWAYSASSSGPWNDIFGATSATYTPSTVIAPFNSAGTYYVIRKAVLSSVNNVNPNPYIATNESNVATITIKSSPVPSFTVYPGPSECQGDDVDYTTEPLMTNYTWLVPGTDGIDYSITSGGTDSNTVRLKWLTTGSKTVTVGYTDGNGCASATPASSTITVNPTPVIGTFN